MHSHERLLVYNLWIAEMTLLHYGIFLSVPLLLHSMGQIIRSLASVCLCVFLCVCHRSYDRNYE